MFFALKSYFNFLLKSTNQHGVHSPFVFDLVTKCFYDKTEFPEYKILKKYRKSLLSNHETIEVTDFGAGSRIFKSNIRKVSDIAKTAGISKKRAELLFRVMKYFKPKNVLEIGTSLGLATSALAVGNENSEITSLEGCAQTSNVAQKNLHDFKLKNVRTIVSEFETGLLEFRLSTFDLIYFDGNHQKDATLRYFDLLLPTTTNDSVWIFDDIHWSEQMTEAWEIIKQNPKVTVTIDTFQWGFVFFRKEQEKENFTIRA
ncbi:MAG: class I SAM-dependent methyltransferase [Flavobacterium sp.]|uniref:O-methyltransferase n=1 Tax=Flavobacterium sp. TaxID=239 RepID=UPI00122809A5|nr:class I SAM-dependent methyltransferase [Flavobacterium sp.]RZJ63286.1 MAG: class I SAM-dependent methyltransferase [Flavobacterium sp.]